MDKVTVSTDGSCLSTNSEGQGPIGWSVIEHANAANSSDNANISADINKKDPLAYMGNLNDKRIAYIRHGGAVMGTNQIAELSAILVALRTYKNGSPKSARHLVIETDSSYSINSATTWIQNWKRNGWKNSKKKLISNIELIQAIDQEIISREQSGGTLEFVKVKGHSGEFFNEASDKAANEQSEHWQQIVVQNGINAYQSPDFSRMPKEAIPPIMARLNPVGDPDELTLL